MKFISEHHNSSGRAGSGSSLLFSVIICVLSALIIILLLLPGGSADGSTDAGSGTVTASSGRPAADDGQTLKSSSAAAGETSPDNAQKNTAAGETADTGGDVQSGSTGASGETGSSSADKVSTSSENVPVWETYDTETEYAWICENESLFPEDKVSFAQGNADLIHFMYNYGHGEIPSVKDTGLTDEEKSGGIPFLYQWDERWGYETYGNTVMGFSGCGPTSLAMVIVGLTGRTDVTPYTVAQYADEHGYYVNNQGTSWDLFDNGCADWGLSSWRISNDEGEIKETLTAGHPVIISVREGMFTYGGHIMVLTGVDNSGRLVLHDPNNRTYSSQTFLYSDIADQIVELWAFQPA